MAKKKNHAEEDLEAEVAALTFEQAMEQLESIIDRIERGEIGLEESLAQRKRGDALVKRCRVVLDAAEQELQQISPEDDQAPSQ